MDAQVGEWVCVCTDRSADVYMQVDGYVGGQIYGWLSGQIDKQMDG